MSTTFSCVKKPKSDGFLPRKSLIFLFAVLEPLGANTVSLNFRPIYEYVPLLNSEYMSYE